MPRLFVALALALAACSSEPPPALPAGNPVTSLDEVRGSWDIVEFGDYRPQRIGEDGGRRATVTFGDDGVGSFMECNHYSGVEGDFDRSGAFRDKPPGPQGMISTLMLCPPPVDAREGEMMGYFRTDPKAVWVSSGRLLLDNGRRRIVLERPESARLRSAPALRELQGEWRPTGHTHFDQRGGYSGGAFPSDPGYLTISRDTLRLSQCPSFVSRFAYGDDKRLRVSDPDAAEDALIECFGYAETLEMLKPLLDAPFAENAGKDRLVLDADGGVLSLMRGPAWRAMMADMEAGVVRDADGNPVPPSAARLPPSQPPSPPPPGRASPPA